MTELSFRDLILHFLQKDYTIRAGIANDLSLHIEKIYDDYIIGSDDKKKIQRDISELIKVLNKMYNTILARIKTNALNPKTKDDALFQNLDAPLKDFIGTSITNIDSITDIINLLRTYNPSIIKKLRMGEFKQIDQQLKMIGSKYGLGSLNNILSIYYSPCYNYVIPENVMKTLAIYNKMLIPIAITEIKSTSTDNISCNYFEGNDDRYEILLENVFVLTVSLKSPNKSYEILGYMNIDCLNSVIRTSQICINFIYERKKKISDAVDKLGNIAKGFRTIYLKNLSLGDILCLDDQSIKKKITDDYYKYIKYSNMNFKKVMEEFLQVEFKIKFQIIKFLLMGQTSSINVAGLLFGLTKDYKDSKDNRSKPTIIADIIYKNLNYPAQIKLRKSNVLIKQELERLKALNYEDVDMKKQIITNKNMPQHVKKIALEKIEEMKSGSSEYYKQMQYVKILIDYPWIGDNDTDIFTTMKSDLDKCRSFLDNSKNKLDKIVYGHDECKSVILELLGKWFTNPNSMGKAIGLRGPPGVGKTLLAKGLGDVLGIPFTQINVGGVEDGSVLSGHSFTYSGAQPGIIIRKMIDAGSPRCIMFFDELDKSCTKHGINEVFNVLIHVTDSNTNTHFNDKFFQEVTFPLNKVLFVFSYNDRDKIDKILLDRMEEIEIMAYTMDDKIKITKDYMLKEISEGIGIDTGSIVINDPEINYLTESFTFEAGVRELKRKLETLFLKLNMDRIYAREPFNTGKIFSKESPIIVTQAMIDNYLKKPQIHIKKVHTTDEIGVINGLYATTVGSGGIIPILIYKHHMGKDQKFVLKLTGSQGKVMKESIMFAFTIAMNMIKDKYITTFINSYPSGLHIHTPDGATPKDGPSAGSAFTVAFISRILGKKIKHNIAMTGEIELNGRITAIGGLEYKLTGAKRANVNLVFVPKENEDDYIKIKRKNPKMFDDTFRVIIVEHIFDIVDYALIDDKPKKDKDLTYEKTFNSNTYLERDKNSNKMKKIMAPKTKREDTTSEESNSDTNNEESESSEVSSE